jgi:dinuclear metal center YbgI/SA1388 family protein
MKATVADIIIMMNAIAPPALAEKWDNVGLQVGLAEWNVQKVWVALDPTPQVMAAACKDGVDLLITHHPLIFNPLKSIDLNTTTGRVLHQAIVSKTAIFTAHTNLDAVAGGVNDVLAERIGLKNTIVLAETATACDGSPPITVDNHHGLGRVGELEKEMCLKEFTDIIRENLGLPNVKVAGNPGLPVFKAAVCSGSGSGLMRHFYSSGAQVYISGDIGYHDARDIECANLGLVDIGHFASEQLIVDPVVKRLHEMAIFRKMDLSIKGCTTEKDPFWYINKIVQGE